VAATTTAMRTARRRGGEVRGIIDDVETCRGASPPETHGRASLQGIIRS
jgi:hypothetical protein